MEADLESLEQPEPQVMERLAAFLHMVTAADLVAQPVLPPQVLPVQLGWQSESA